MAVSERVLRTIAKRMQSDPNLAASFQQDPMKAIGDANLPVYFNDPWIYRAIVIILGITVVLTAVGAMILKDVPAGLVSLGSVALGALAGLLAPSPARSE